MAINNRNIEFRCWDAAKQRMYYEDFVLYRNKIYFPQLKNEVIIWVLDMIFQ